MVPDFDRLRKQPRDRSASRSVKLNPHKGFTPKIIFQQFDTQPETSLTRAHSSEGDHLFFQLWLDQPSWSPIIKKANGWITIINPSGKKVPLVLGTVESHYRRNIILGKRFGKLTNYLMIDVDTGSPFHPSHGGIEPILAAMEAIGLCRFLLIRSSASGGLHIYFPLAEPVSAWGLACAAHAALSAAGISIAGGVCELFPNKKAFNAEHNGHRLPLQDGSFILDSDFRCISSSKAVFLAQWQLCTAGQDKALLAELLTEKPVPIPKRIASSSLPPIAWTGTGQSNEVMKELVNYGDRYVGLKTIPALGDWIVAVAPQLPGFSQFASEESRNDLTRRNWAYRWAKSHFKSVRQYAAKKSFDHNAMIAAEALERLMVALNEVVIVGKCGIRKLWQTLSDISKKLFGVGFSWGLFQKHRTLILEKVRSSRNVGLSRRNEEVKSSISPELAKPSNPEPEKRLPELLTPRSVISKHGIDLRASRTSTEPEGLGARQEAELAMGTTVMLKPAGSAGEGVETRVTGKTTQPDGTLLYRLEECVEEQPLLVARDCLAVVADEECASSAGNVIKASAAQLLQVLGKACPFVGPGLWTVKRDEVPAKTWGQLCKLIGEV